MLAMMILDLDGFDLHHQEGRRHLTYKKKSMKLIVKIMISTLIPDMQDRQNFPLHNIKGSQSIAMKH